MDVRWMRLAVTGAALMGLGITPVVASSHREAPMISQDPEADNTDVYAFVSPEPGRQDRVVLIANFIPLEKKESGPNFWGFGDNVLYEIKVDNNGDAIEDITFQFQFHSFRNNENTFLYNTGQVHAVDDSALNVRQSCDVTMIMNGRSRIIGQGIQVCPSNAGTTSMPDFAAIRTGAIRSMRVSDPSVPGGGDDIRVFTGQRAEQFYLDLGAIFDLLQVKPASPVNATKDVNVHTIALEVPKKWLARDKKEPTDAKGPTAVIGVWSTASRRQFRATNFNGHDTGGFVQVSRLGSPLVNEVVIPLKDKDKFNASRPRDDKQFLTYVTDPELAKLFTAVLNVKCPPAPREDLVQVFLTGVPGLNQPPNVKPAEMLRLNMAIPPAKEPNRLGVVGGDLAGYPNGRRPGDDVVDIALQAVAGVLVKEFQATAKGIGDGVDKPDQPFLTTFPFLADPTPAR